MNAVQDVLPFPPVEPCNRLAGIAAANMSEVERDACVRLALEVLQRQRRPGTKLGSPCETGDYLRLRLSSLGHEVFVCLFLDNRHRVIAMEEMFRGTIDGCSVHPREIAKRALELNAAAVIAAHNHPSGDPDPSQADRSLTRRLHESLALLDVRLLDHLVVGHEGAVSFAERGWL